MVELYLVADADLDIFQDLSGDEHPRAGAFKDYNVASQQARTTVEYRATKIYKVVEVAHFTQGARR